MGDMAGIAAAVVGAVGGRSFLRENLIYCALGIMVCSVVAGILNYVSRINIAKGSEGFTKKLRDSLFAHIQRLPFQWHTDNQTGDIIQRCTFDVETVRNFVAAQLLEVLQTVILVTIALVLMFSMNVALSLVCAAFIPVIVLYSLFFYGRISRQFREADEAEGELLSGIQENLTGVRVVRAFGREKHEKDRFDQKLNFFTKKWIDMGYTLGFYWGVGDLATASQILAVVCAGAWLAATNRATLGELVAFISYTTTLSWPVRSLGRTLSELSKAGVSIDRLREILESPAETDMPGAVRPDLYDDISFEHVSFGYGDVRVLDDLSFRIPKGSTFGILGATGSGKSTITYLLNRLYELPADGGAIRIGDTDIRDIERAHLRRGIGLVLQEPFLFSRSVRRNIGISLDRPPLELIREKAEIAAVDDNIGEFKDGYDTRVGERGVTLSGGQKQRIAIARTLMTDCPVMVFDDSTSSVDMETDARIWQSIREHTSGKTVVIISHRISTLIHADKILVLENGRAAQTGSHEELIARDGVYKRVYQMQSDALLLKGGSAYSESSAREGDNDAPLR